MVHSYSPMLNNMESRFLKGVFEVSYSLAYEICIYEVHGFVDMLEEQGDMKFNIKKWHFAKSNCYKRWAD